MKKLYRDLLICDGSYMLHRNLHIPNIFDLRAPSGERSGGIFAFLKSLTSEIKKNPGFPVVAWDAGLSPRRVKADPNYKDAQNRLKEAEVLTEEDADNDYLTQYRRQRSVIIEILTYLGIPSFRYTQWEGDDLQFILTRLSKHSIVISDDRDMIQLLSPFVNIRRPMHDDTLEYEKFLEENNYESMSDYVIEKSIIGDGSDSIPGCCKGVGGKLSHNMLKLLKSGTERSVFKDESLLREECVKLEIPYRKAYLNFDFDRFNTNLELIDLNKVLGDINATIIDSIVNNISSCRNNVNLFSALRCMKKLGITEVDCNEIVSLVSERYKSDLFI